MTQARSDGLVDMRLTRAVMVDFEQARTPDAPKQRKARVLEMPMAGAVAH